MSCFFVFFIRAEKCNRAAFTSARTTSLLRRGRPSWSISLPTNSYEPTTSEHDVNRKAQRLSDGNSHDLQKTLGTRYTQQDRITSSTTRITIEIHRFLPGCDRTRSSPGRRAEASQRLWRAADLRSTVRTLT
jgi:hypothetical protein